MKQKQVFNNAKWIIVCKIAQSVLQLIIGMISARYLGPSNYGLINYAASIVAFAMPIMKLGLDAILVHQLVESPESEGEIMGTSLFLNVVSSFLCMAGVCGFAFLVNMGQRETIIVCALYSVTIFFAALEMMQYWFQYKLLSKYSSLIMLVGYVFVSAYKIFLLATGKSIYWFAFSHSVEYGAIGILLLLFFGKKSNSRLSVSLARAKKMLKISRHYILAALMVVVIQNIDRVMLTTMVSETENGYYSAAVTSAAVAQFVFMAIIDSFRPLILESKKNDQLEYEKNMSKLYGAILYLSLAQSVMFTIFAPLVVKVLYGAEFAPAVGVLRILTWYTGFSYMGSLRNIWLLAEEKQRYLPAINLSGVVLNVAINLFVIPRFGAMGAATVSFITQFFMNFVLTLVLKPLRPCNRLMLKGLMPNFFFPQLKEALEIIFKKEKPLK